MNLSLSFWTVQDREYIPEDPPGDGDHPHDDGDHEHDVVHHVAAKLAEAAGHIVATSLMMGKLLDRCLLSCCFCTWLFLVQKQPRPLSELMKSTNGPKFWSVSVPGCSWCIASTWRWLSGGEEEVRCQFLRESTSTACSALLDSPGLGRPGPLPKT